MRVTTSQVQASIIAPKCSAFAGCHGSQATQASLDMSVSAEALEARLIDVRSTTALCRGRTFVKRGDPDQSLLFVKLTTTATLCGDRMPQGSELSAPEKAMMRQWLVDLGAP